MAVAIIGAGVMGETLLSGLLRAGTPAADAWQPQAVVPPGQLAHGTSVFRPAQVQAGRSLTIGRDLKVDRREKAEAVAAAVPTLTIVGDLFGPHDGTVSHESARLTNARS